VQHVGREISNEFALGDFERSPPHLFLYLLLFKRKTMVKTNKDSTGFEHRRIYTLFNEEVLEVPNFIFILLLLLLLFSIYILFCILGMAKWI